MFRPIPEAALFRRVPYRLIASLLLIVALGVTVTLLLSLEQGKLLLVLLVGAISLAAVITFFHYHSTKRTLEEVKGLARNILQSIPTGILTVNRSGIITAVNPTAEAVLKRPAADLLGNSYESVFARGETIREVLDEALRTHRHVSQKDLPYEGGHRGIQTIRVSTVELKEDDGQPQTPDPKLVIALGDCAIHCGVFKGSYAVTGPVDRHIHVDVRIPGCPPRPAEILKVLEDIRGPRSSSGK